MANTNTPTTPSTGFTHWKAWIAFLGAVATSLVTLVADPNFQAVLPHNWQPYLALLTGSVVTGLLAWLKRNPITPDQIDHAVSEGHISTADVTKIVEKHSTQVVDDVSARHTGDLTSGVIPEHQLPTKKPSHKRGPRTPPEEGVPPTPHKPPLG